MTGLRAATVVGRNEARRLLRDPSLLLAGIFLTVLLGAALLATQVRREAQARDRETAARRSRAQWDAHGAMNPHEAAHYGIWVYKPITPLATLDPGLDPYVGVASHLVAHRASTPIGPPSRDANRYARWAEPTALGVVLLLLPLVAILVGSGSMVDERSAGTLRQALAEGVPRWAFALGKVAGVGGTLLLLLSPAAILAGVLATRGSGDARAAALWAGAALLYLAAIVGLSLAVSAISPNRPTALVALLAFFALNSFIAPRVASERAARIYPTRNGPQLAEAVREHTKRAEESEGGYVNAKARLVAGLLAKYRVKREQDLPVNPEGFLLQRGEEMQDRAYDAVYGAVDREHERQDAYVARIGGLFSPGVAFASVSSDLAQTNGAAQRRFLRSVENYRRDWVRRLNMDLALNSKPGQPYEASPSLFRSIPRFAHRPLPEVDVARSSASGFALLSGWAFACLGFAFLAAMVMKPEAA